MRKISVLKVTDTLAVIGGIAFLGLCLYLWYQHGIGRWFREVASVLWVPSGFFSILTLVVGMSYKQKKELDDAYLWMKRSALAALLTIFCLWLVSDIHHY